jgi:predicted Zn-dependent protease with MMP-like domain
MAKVPLPVRRRGFRVSRRRFDRAVQEIVDGMPETFQPYMADIEFITADTSPDGALGLYQGAGALGQHGWPARITIYRRPHEARSHNWRQFIDEVRRTIRHEVGHHFQMEEDELPY